MGAFRALSLAAMSQLVACLFVHPSPMTSTRLMGGSAVKMQYGQQQGYGGGYGQQQGYGAQQQGYGSQVLWRIYGANGVCGHTMFTGAVSAVNKNRFGSIGEKYSQLPYTLVANDERILSKWNMINNQVPTVSRSQCKVNLYPDGTAVLTSQGSYTHPRAQSGRRVDPDLRWPVALPDERRPDQPGREQSRGGGLHMPE